MSVSEEICIICCETVRDLGFWVGNQHTGRCTQGCEGEDCGTGFACQAGKFFLIGLVPPLQEDSTGTFRTYQCLADGSVNDIRLETETPSQSPIRLPTALPTALPTTQSPSANPTTNPTPFPTNPTSAPVRFPTELPTFNPTIQPTTKIPTFAPTGFPTLAPGTILTDSPASFFSDPSNIIAIMIMGLLLFCFCACCCFIYFICLLRPKKEQATNDVKEKIEHQRTNSLPVVKAVIQKDIDDDGNPIIKGKPSTAQILAAKARVASWKITRNVFSSDPNITHAKRSYNNQSRDELPIPAFPTERRISDESQLSTMQNINIKELEALETDILTTQLRAKTVVKNRNGTRTTGPSTSFNTSSEAETEDIEL